MNKPERQRRSIRLKERDYSRPGAYFVTICAYQRLFLFGEVVDGQMQLNVVGHLALKQWNGLPQHFPTVEVVAFVVMPNHMHGVILLKEGVDAQTRRPTLGQVVAYFKYQVTKEANRLRGGPGTPMWQRNYYERIIRDDGELARVRLYIVNNPANWREDEENPTNIRTA